MSGTRGQSGVPLGLLWALATLLIVLAVFTWRWALSPDDSEPTAGGDGRSAGAAVNTTPAEVPFVACGEEAPDSALNLEARACLLDAAAGGKRVEFSTARTTTEGQPVYWRVRVLAWGDIEVTVDNRADEFSGSARRRVRTFRCTGLARSPVEEGRVEAAGCSPDEVVIF